MKIRIRHTYKKVSKPSGAAPVGKLSFLMTGGGTGGHIIPAIAVARELRRRDHEVFFVGTKEGLESKLVPAENFPIEYISIGGLKRVGLQQTVRTLLLLPVAVMKSMLMIRKHKPAAVFSMGGYVSGPATIAAWLMARPVVLMEPNAMPGMANRSMAKLARRALLSFPEARQFFPPGRVEMTGLPVRAEFFALGSKLRTEKITILITGGSRGSRRLNEAGKECWPLFERAKVPVRWIHQTGSTDYTEVAAAFEASGSEGQVVPFLDNMPQAFEQSDLIVCRSGAGAVSEIAAAGKPSVLVPFPYAADQHQLRNAESMSKAGAARLILDHECTGHELFHTIRQLASEPDLLERMGRAAKQFAKPDAARRAVEILEEEAIRSVG